MYSWKRFPEKKDAAVTKYCWHREIVEGTRLRNEKVNVNLYSCQSMKNMVIYKSLSSSKTDLFLVGFPLTHVCNEIGNLGTTTTPFVAPVIFIC